MTTEQIETEQKMLTQTKRPDAERSAAFARTMSRWAENSRKYGIVPLSRTFNGGRA